MRETRLSISAFLEEVAPDKHHQLWKVVISKPLDPQYPIKEQVDVDSVLMEALAQSVTKMLADGTENANFFLTAHFKVCMDP